MHACYVATGLALDVCNHMRMCAWTLCAHALGTYKQPYSQGNQGHRPHIKRRTASVRIPHMREDLCGGAMLQGVLHHEHLETMTQGMYKGPRHFTNHTHDDQSVSMHPADCLPAMIGRHQWGT